MNEESRREKSPAPESLEEQKHQEFQAAQVEEERIMKEIDNALASAPDRAQAERTVLKEFGPAMDAAKQKSSEALQAWLRALSELYEHDIRQLGDTEKDL